MCCPSMLAGRKTTWQILHREQVTGSGRQSRVWAGSSSPVDPKQSPDKVGFFCCGEDVHPGVLAEELMQKTRHHREVGHLGCVIQDTLGKSKGGGEEGEEEEEKTEF